MEKCDLCGKDRKNFDGYVAYSSDFNEAHLCRSCYMKWNYHHKDYEKKHNEIKPTTKAWMKMCDEEGKLFEIWFKEHSPKSEEKSQ